MQKANGHEAGADGNNITGASPGDPDAYTDRGVSGAATITFDNDHAYGSLAAKMLKASGELVYASWTYTGLTTLWGRSYLWTSANPSANMEIVRALNAGLRASVVQLKTDGKLAVIDEGGTVRGTSTNSIALSAFVRLEWRFVHSTTAGVIEVKIFNSPDSASETETLTSTGSFSTLAASDQIRIGDSAAAATAFTGWFDLNLINDTGYPGPAGGGGPTLRVNRGAMMW